MENIKALSLTVVFCLGIGTCALTSDTIIMSTEAEELRSETVTISDGIDGVFTGLAWEDTTSAGGIEPPPESNTIMLNATADESTTTVETLTVKPQTDKSVNLETTIAGIYSTVITPTATSHHSTNFHSTAGQSEDILTTDDISHSTETQGHPTIGTTSHRNVMETSSLERVYSTNQMIETTDPQTTTRPSLTHNRVQSSDRMEGTINQQTTTWPSLAHIQVQSTDRMEGTTDHQATTSSSLSHSRVQSTDRLKETTDHLARTRPSLTHSRVQSTDQMEGTTHYQATTKPFLSTAGDVPDSEVDQDHHSRDDEPIDLNHFDTRPASREFAKPNLEISSQTNKVDEDDLYYDSPQYIQRKNINHAAVWITVGFVAILLTYILALFIHEKGRAEWRMATEKYSRFENESTQDEDSTSITMDLDEPSTPFTVTSAVIETTSTQNLMLQPSRKSH